MVSARTSFNGVPTMPFGRYKGVLLEDIPTSYLRWLLDEVDLRPFLREAVEREIRFRAEECPDRPSDPAPVPATWSSIIRQWHREMALRFHPDRGGSPEAMGAINHAVGRLKELLSF